MTQEDKELLLRDLSARLQYGVLMQVLHCRVECKHHLLGVNIENNTVRIDHCNELNEELFISNWMPINDCKPYLRPMSSMTEEEKKIMRSCGFELIIYDTGYTGFANIESCIDEVSFGFMEKFLNAHHFDYRGLIPMGLALEAPKDMYK